MKWALYDEEGYVGDVSAPDRETAVEFVLSQGYQPGSFELRELTD